LRTCALMGSRLRVSDPPSQRRDVEHPASPGMGDSFPHADLNEAALRRTLSRVAERAVVALG